MSTQVQRRKGTTAQHATFTGASAELTVDTTKNTVVVHDGATAGGIPLAKETGSAISATSLTSSGASVISVTDNTNAALRITQLGSGNALLVEDSTNPDATPFQIDFAGRVIAGYTALVAPDVNAPTVFPQMNVVGVTSTAQYSAFSYINAAANAPIVSLSKSRGAAIGTNTIVANGDTIGTIKFTAADGTAFVPAASITAQVDGTPGTNDMPGRLVFSTTADGASSPTERMRIASNGDISIAGGTANGVAYLNGSKVLTSGTALTFDGTTFAVAGKVTATPAGITQPVIIGQHSDAAVYGVISFSGSTSAAGTTGLAGGGSGDNNLYVKAPTGYAVNTAINNSTVTAVTSTGLEVKQSQLIGYSSYAGIGTNGLAVAGNVGIGTSSPQSRLHVSGPGNAEGIIDAPSASAILSLIANATAGGIIAYKGVSLRFGSATGYGAAGYSEQMRLDASGNLLVGATAVGYAAKSQFVKQGTTSANNSVTDSAVLVASASAAAGETLGLRLKTGAGISGTTFAGQLISSGNNIFEIYTAAASPLVFGTDATERARIDSSGNLGLGIIPRNGDGNLQLPSTGTIAYGNNNSTLNAWITTNSYNFTSGNALTIATQPALPIIFGTNNTERARFNSTGAFVFAGGTTTADGIGITFPATQSASSNANTLDDYEEGTWTPIDSSGQSLVFTSVSGVYTKIGNLCIISCTLTYPSTANGGDASIGGLPFISATANYSGGCVTYTTCAQAPSILIPSASIVCNPRRLVGGDPIANNELSLATIRITASYRVT